MRAAASFVAALWLACTALAAVPVQQRVPVAVVGAESALGYATAIALGKDNVLALHGSYNLTALQLVRVLHLRELGVKTLAADFADATHVYRFNASFSADRIALFADVGDEATVSYLLAVRRSLQDIEDMREGQRRMAVSCFATDIRLPWVADSYCKPAPLVESAVPPAPALHCEASGKCAKASLASWRSQLLSLSIGEQTGAAVEGAEQLPQSLQEMLRQFPTGCNTDARLCKPVIIEYLKTDYERVSFGGSMTMERRHKYALPSAGFFEYPCGFLGPTTYDQADWRKLTAGCEVVIATAIFGGSDSLQPAPFLPEAKYDDCFIAVLDVPTATKHHAGFNTTGSNAKDAAGLGRYGAWKTVSLRPDHRRPFPYASSRRTSRIPKLITHRLFPDAKYTIWVDGNNVINQTVSQFIANTVDSEHTMALGVHKGGRTPLGESRLTGRQLEHAKVAKVQEAVYSLDYARFNKDRIMWATAIVRDNRDLNVHWQSCVWFNEWARYSQRDQVSEMWAMSKTGTKSIARAFPYGWINGVGHKNHHGSQEISGL